MTATVTTTRPGGRTRRDRVVDVACVAATLVVALLWLVDSLDVRHDPPWYLALSLALVPVAAVAVRRWRRSHPVVLALALAPASAFTEAVGGAGAVALFTVAVHRPARVTLWIAALHLVAVVPLSILRPDPALSLAGYHVLSVVAVSAVIGWGMLVRRRRRRLAAARERVTRAEAAARDHDDRVRAAERDRIAREMHDVLAHRVSLVALHAGALEVRPDLPPEEVARTAGTIRSTAHEALDDLREILGVLRAGDEGGGLRPQPGVGQLADLVAQARAAGTPVTASAGLLADVAGTGAGAAGGPAGGPAGGAGAGPVPASLGRTVYRIVQEGLTNARKHAPGAEVALCVDGAPGGELHVSLRNPLRAAGAAPGVQPPGSRPPGAPLPGAPLPGAPLPGAPLPGARAGLVGLAERVALAGGRLDHGVRRGTDGAIAFHLEAWLPWPKP